MMNKRILLSLSASLSLHAFVIFIPLHGFYKDITLDVVRAEHSIELSIIQTKPSIKEKRVSAQDESIITPALSKDVEPEPKKKIQEQSIVTAGAITKEISKHLVNDPPKSSR